MSRSTSPTEQRQSNDALASGSTAPDTGESETTVLDLLADEGCRAILAETSADARSATELAEECDLPLSTVYRKLDRLTAADLLVEGTRICTTGSHEREFVRRVEDVRLGFDPTGDVTLEVTSRSNREEGEEGAPGRTGP